MKFLSKHWCDFGGVFALIILSYVVTNYNNLTDYQLLMWVSLITLFFHQLEEYRIVGTFPGMVNSVMYNSKKPDRFPLNAKTSTYVNVMGWVVYFLAALFAEKAIWLGLATIIVSAGNTVGHTITFNLKGKTIYNAGLATCWLLLVPCIYFFFYILLKENLATTTDYFIGVPLGMVLNYVGVLKMIEWMADEKTPYIFPQRNVLHKDRT